MTTTATNRYISCQTCHKPVGNEHEAETGKCYDCEAASAKASRKPFTRFPEMPVFTGQTIDIRSNRNMAEYRHGSESLAWSNRTMVLPTVGQEIRITMNGIGPAKVIGYFSEDGYLGIVAKPHNPPEWLRKQHAAINRDYCTVFGTEISPV